MEEKQTTEGPYCSRCGGSGRVEIMPTGYLGDPRPGFLFVCDDGCTSPESHTPFISGAKALGPMEIAALKESTRVLALVRRSHELLLERTMTEHGFDHRNHYVNRDTWSVEPTTNPDKAVA